MSDEPNDFNNDDDEFEFEDSEDDELEFEDSEGGEADSDAEEPEDAGAQGSEGQEEAEGRITCQECNKEKATVHITDLADGKPVQKHLCKKCARKLKEYPREIDEGQIFAHLFGHLLPELKELSTKICPGCKLAYMAFRHTERLGCERCYEAFGPVLETMIERLHGAKQHVGKIPPLVSQGVALESRIRTLERLMDEAVAREEYERAARLRDEIKELKSKQGT